MGILPVRMIVAMIVSSIIDIVPFKYICGVVVNLHFTAFSIDEQFRAINVNPIDIQRHRTNIQ